jgi:hypothetical protein
MPVHVNLPSLIRVDGPSRFGSTGWLDAALAPALRRAVRSARGQLTDRSLPAQGTVHPIRVSWTGPGAPSVDAAVRRRVETQLVGIVDRLVAAEGLAGSTASATAASAAAATVRPWSVLAQTNLRMRVRDYFEYLRQVLPDEDYSQYFLDVLHETRWCIVWLVRANVATEAAALYPAVVERMNELSPLGADQIPLWTATPREVDRQALIRLDRHNRVATSTSSLTEYNRGTVFGGRLQAFLLPGARILFTRMKLPQLPTLTFGPGGADVFWDALQRSLMEGDRAARADAIETLLMLRMYPRARELLEQGMDVGQDLADMDRLGIRVDIVIALENFRGRPYSIALLILYGVGHKIDRTPQRIFRDWFKTGGGIVALAFLERVLLEGDAAQKRKAAIVVLDLLDFARTDEARPYRRNVARLHALSRRQDLWAGGPLGEESLRQLVQGQVDVLLDQVYSIDRSLRDGPLFDPTKDALRTTVATFHAGLETYRESVGALSLTELEAARTRLEAIILGAMHVQARIDGIHTGVRRIRDFLGSISAESDEITLLFQLRDRYVDALSGALTDTDFASTLRGIDVEGDNFSGMVAQHKWDRARGDFNQAVTDVINNDILRGYNGAGPVQDPAFHDMKRQLTREMESLHERFYRPPAYIGGRRFVIGPVVRRLDPLTGAIAEYEHGYPRDVDDAVDIETRVAIFRIHTAMFGHLSVALLLENQIVQHDIGSASFQRTQRTRLLGIRSDITQDWNQNRLQAFIDRDPEIVRTLEDVQYAVKRAIREAIALELLITVAAALLSFGAGLIVRAALVGRTVALVRTARAVETAVFLTEVGVFTGAQLGGEALAFGRPITLGRAATATLHNLAFLGGFRILGRLTGPLLERGAWGFVAVHSINAAALTGVSAVAARVQTGRWPQDITSFLAYAIGSYILIAGAASAARALLHPRLAPIMEARILQRVETLDTANRALLRRIITTTERGRMTQPEFRRMKQSMRDNVAQARELAKQMRDAGLRSRDDFREYDEALTRMDEVLASFEFNPPAGYGATRGGERVILELPAPESLPTVVRQGETEIYRYDALQRSREIENALTRYGDAGHRIERLPGGLIRVSDFNGRLVFVLDPGPRLLPAAPQPAGLLTAGTGARPLTLVERAYGRGYLTEASQRTLEQQLDTINPRLRDVLSTEFQDHTALLALRVFTRQYPQPWTRWPIDAVRGLATMLQTHRGVPLRAVLRMFESRTSAELAPVFEKYASIADRPGANLLVQEDLRPGSSIDLINAYDAIRIARLQLPDGMNRQALNGLLRWIRDGRNVTQELGRIPLDRRLDRLQSDSPIRDPRPAPSAIQQVLQRHAAPIRSGLDLFSGSPADVTMAVVSHGQRTSGGFQRAEARAEFEALIRRYRERVSDFQSSGVADPSETGLLRNIEGLREEIETVLVAMEIGAQVFSLGDVRAFRITIDPGHYRLPRGYRITDTPRSVEIQLDVGAQRASGRLLIIEATTGEISLPREWNGLDPQSGEPANGTISWTALTEGNASHRKWLQAVKLRAAAHFARDLGEAWGRQAVDLPELVIRVGRATAPARRALEAMGFTVVEGNPSP